jgi:NAD(P)-dependent dehydrogenase (short-subunit alcohol dehydrogenase family)
MNTQIKQLGTVVVTGVSSGIGKAIAEDLMTAGYKVFGSVRKAADTEMLAASFGDRFRPLLFDVTDAETLPSIVQTVEFELEGAPLLALVNNAGISLNGPLMLQPMSEIRKTFEVNLCGLLEVTRAFLPLLGAGVHAIERPGRVINISSVSGAMTAPFMGAYSASKHALEALSQALRRELIPYGIEVSTIEPNFIRTSIFEKADQRYRGTHVEAMRLQFNKSLLSNEDKAKSPQLVTKALLHALRANRPRTRYPLDAAWYGARIVSDRMFDKIIFRALGIQQLVVRDAGRSGV